MELEPTPMAKRRCGLLFIFLFRTTKDMLVPGKVRILLMNVYSLLKVLAKKISLCKYYSKFF